MKKHNLFGQSKKCLYCQKEFQPTTQNKTQTFCSRSCVTKYIKPHQNKPHLLKTKQLISKNRKGKCLGHPFWGNLEFLKSLGRKNGDRLRKIYPIIKCARKECDNLIQLKSKDPHKKFCSISCAMRILSKIGERSFGRTPSDAGGRCKWYLYYSPIAGLVKVQGTWELRMAKCLDIIGKSWRTNHNKDRFEYIDENGNKKTYAPDFFSEGKYIEIKGYIDKENQWKFKQMKKLKINLEIIDWQRLKEYEIRFLGETLGGVNTPLRTMRNLIYSNL